MDILTCRAFCNPADVEAFTEEKKQSLLIKRQGKGADFVRAVQEIIDSYEKSKKQDQVDNYNSADKVTQANCGNSADSSASKDLTDTCEATVEFRLETSNSIINRNGLSIATGVQAEAKIDGLCEKESASQQLSEMMLVKETPVLTTYSSRKRSGGLRSQKSIALQKAPPVRRSRSSSRVESSRFQNFMTSSDEVRTACDVSTNVIQNGSLRRNKRVRKSIDASESDDVDSSALMSNGSVDDNGSGIATVDSDAVSLNEGSTMDSSCKPEHSETVTECLEGDVELSKGLDFQIKAVVNKKKRKQIRKRVNDSSELLARMDVEAVLDLGNNTIRQSLQNNASENLNERHSKDDGDEHLPLVKRARVRMGKLSAADEFNSSSPTEEEPVKERAVNSLEQISPSSSFHNDSPTDRDSSGLKEALVNVSPSKCDTQVQGSRPEPLKVVRNQLGCLADGEAALPPSKRLHRALEAMSANAAEDQACGEHSPTMKLPDEQCHVSQKTSCSLAAVEHKEANGLEQHAMDLVVNSDSGIFSISNSIPLEKFGKSSSEPDVCSQPAKSPNSLKQDFPKDVFVDPMNDVSCDTHKGQSLEHSSPNTNNSQAHNCGSSDQPLPSKDDSDPEPVSLSNFMAENPDEQINTSEHAVMSLDPIPGTEKTGKSSPRDGSNVFQCTSHQKSESLKSQTDDSSLVNNM